MINNDNELEIVTNFANQLSLHRVKTEGIYFDRDYRRDENGQIHLITEKAVVTTHGKTSKVLFGDNQKYKTYEEAVEQTKQHWSAYFKQRRDAAKGSKSPVALAGERKRQKAYRERRKMETDEFKQRQ